MRRAESERRPALIAFAATLLLDLCWRSQFFNFDGVACAIAVELSDFKHLVHGNHLAYGVLGWSFDRLLRALGYSGTALWSLQLLDGILGAAGAAALASLLKRSGRTEREALLGAAALAVSHAWWYWSLEAQVYVLGAACAALAAREALSEKPRPELVGAWHAAAALGHVGHLTALPALAWLLSRRAKKDLKPYLLSLSVLLGAAYLAAGVLAVRPASWTELSTWLLGSASMGPGNTFRWHAASPLWALESFAAMTLRVFVEFDARTGAAKWAGVVLSALPLAAAVEGARRGSRAAKFWLATLAGSAALYLLWEPYTIVYRVGDMVALWSLAWLGLERLAPRARVAALAAWVAAAGAYNLAFVVLPASDPATNPDLVETNWVAARVPENAWVVVSGRGAVYLPYFAHRRTIDLHYGTDEDGLFARLDRAAATGAPVFVTDRALEKTGLLAEAARYGLEPTASDADFTLYRLRRAASPAAAARKN